MHQIPRYNWILKNSRKKVADSPPNHENRQRLSYDGRRLSTDHRGNLEKWRSQVVTKWSTTQCDWPITCTKMCEHISPVLRSLHWHPISKRIDYKIMLLTFKCIHDSAPTYLQELVQLYEPAHSLRSSLKSLLKIAFDWENQTKVLTSKNRFFFNFQQLLTLWYHPQK